MGDTGPVGELGFGFAGLVVAAHDSMDNDNADFLCDGTDDQVQINEAIASLPEQGGSVYLREGNYVLSDSVTIDRSNVTLKGAGAGTMLTIKAGLNGTMDAVQVLDARKVTVSDLRVIGNSLSHAEGVMRGVYLSNARDCIVSMLFIEDLRYIGIEMHSSNDNLLKSNFIRDCVWDGIRSTNSHGNNLEGNNIWNCGEVGVRLIYSDYNQVGGNMITDLGYHAILLDTSDLNTINDNRALRSQADGIYLYASALNAVSGNQVLNSGNFGIRMSEDAHQNVVSGNSVTASGLHGIVIDMSDHCSVIGNMVLESAWSGIAATEADHSVISGNKVQLSGYNGIYLSYSNFCTVSGNNIFRSYKDGINLSTSKDNVIAGNTVSSSSQLAHATYFGIILSTDSDRNLIDGNTIRRGTDTNRTFIGIYIWGTSCNNNVVINNDLYYSGAGGDYIDDGAGTIYHNNRLTGGWVA
jgi:parallel beta-helix repeat protein